MPVWWNLLFIYKVRRLILNRLFIVILDFTQIKVSMRQFCTSKRANCKLHWGQLFVLQPQLLDPKAASCVYSWESMKAVVFFCKIKGNSSWYWIGLCCRTNQTVHNKISIKCVKMYKINMKEAGWLFGNLDVRWVLMYQIKWCMLQVTCNTSSKPTV